MEIGEMGASVSALGSDAAGGQTGSVTTNRDSLEKDGTLFKRTEPPFSGADQIADRKGGQTVCAIIAQQLFCALGKYRCPV